MDFNFQFRNKVVNGDEITFDVGIDFTGTGLSQETHGAVGQSDFGSYDYFLEHMFLWNKSMVKDLDLTIQQGQYYPTFPMSEDNQLLTTRIIENGVKVNNRAYNNATYKRFYWNANAASPFKRVILHWNPFTAPANWESARVQKWAFRESYGGQTVYRADGTAIPTTNNYYPQSVFFYREDTAVNPFHFFLRVKITLNPGETMPSDIHDLFYIFAPDENPIPSTSFISFLADQSEVTGNFSLTEYSSAGAPADEVSPVITMLGDNPMNVEVGAVFADPGATAIDDIDGAVSVVASGGENINYEYGWIQHDGQTMPNISGGTVYLTSNTYAQSDGFFDNSTDWEVIAEFDNNDVNNGGFALNLYASDWTNGQPFIVFRQQQYNAWGANNSYFFGLWNGSTAYVSSGAGPAQSSSGAMKAKKVGDVIEFYSSTDKVNFTKMGEIDMAANSFSPAQMKAVVYAGSRTVDVTGFSRSDVSEGAQEGSYTITYTAQDAAGNVATAQRSVVVAAAASGDYDWTHSGQLTNIVKFVAGQDLNGNASYAYAKKEDDGSTTLYFTPDLTNFAAFGSYDSGASSIDGSPVFIEYGAGGKVAVGTDTGKVYQIELDEYSVPQNYTLLHDVVGGHPVNSLKYGFAMNVWIFEAGGEIYTIPAAGGGAVLRHTLPAGAKVVDFAEGDDGKVAFIVRLADFSLEPRVTPADWSVIYGPSSMVADAAVAIDFNYSHALDLWVSSDGGSAFTSVTDLLDLLN